MGGASYRFQTRIGLDSSDFGEGEGKRRGVGFWGVFPGIGQELGWICLILGKGKGGGGETEREGVRNEQAFRTPCG